MGIKAPPGIQPLTSACRSVSSSFIVGRRLIQPVEASRHLWRNSHTVRDRSLRHAIDGNRKRPSVRSRRSPFRPLRGTTAGRRRFTPHRSGAFHHLSRDVSCAKSFSRPRDERLSPVESFPIAGEFHWSPSRRLRVAQSTPAIQPPITPDRLRQRCARMRHRRSVAAYRFSPDIRHRQPYIPGARHDDEPQPTLMSIEDTSKSRHRTISMSRSAIPPNTSSPSSSDERRQELQSRYSQFAIRAKHARRGGHPNRGSRRDECLRPPRVMSPLHGTASES